MNDSVVTHQGQQVSVPKEVTSFSPTATVSPNPPSSKCRMTKERFRKTGRTQLYHFVQSFSAEDDVTPQEAGLEFAQKQFPGFEVVVTTHVDTAICTTTWW